MRRENHDFGVAARHVSDIDGSEPAAIHRTGEDEMPLVQIEFQVLFLEREVTHVIALVGVEPCLLNCASDRCRLGIGSFADGAA